MYCSKLSDENKSPTMTPLVVKNLCQKRLVQNSNITRAMTKTSKLTFARFNAISEAFEKIFSKKAVCKFR